MLIAVDHLSGGGRAVFRGEFHFEFEKERRDRGISCNIAVDGDHYRIPSRAEFFNTAIRSESQMKSIPKDNLRSRNREAAEFKSRNTNFSCRDKVRRRE